MDRRHLQLAPGRETSNRDVQRLVHDDVRPEGGTNSGIGDSPANDARGCDPDDKAHHQSGDDRLR